MQNRFIAFLMALITVPWATASVSAQDYVDDGRYVEREVQVVDSGGLLSPAQLEELVAPIALYPDVLIAQILPASTYPNEIRQAVDFLRANGELTEFDRQPWDPSVLALGRYPSILELLNSDPEWTNALGAAFLNQPQDLMDSIQRMRFRAQEAGYLRSGPEITVVQEPTEIRIVSTQPDVVFVPSYDPVVLYDDYYYDPGPSFNFSAFLSFGSAYPVGPWLFTDLDWRARQVHFCRPGYWHGWRGRPAFVHHGADWGVFGHVNFGHHDHGRVWHRGTKVGRPAYYGR